tara:strand:+ start:4045 stop:4713 length:669 start_codon:yes stop_codon:yes gene_type:complete
MSKKILIVDDEPDILEFLRYNLEANGYIVETALNGEQCLKKIVNFHPSLVILDIMMPRMNGVETCQKIKANKSLEDVVVVFLSARNEEFTQIACYDAGGEDFISKPIQPKLLIKKIESILKRVYKDDAPNILNGIYIDHDKYKVIVDNQEIQLTKTQFEVFSLLYSKPDHVFSRERIISKIWGSDYYVSTRNLDVQIRKIREKIGNKKIGTIKGVGYKFCSS